MRWRPLVASHWATHTRRLTMLGLLAIGIIASPVQAAPLSAPRPTVLDAPEWEAPYTLSRPLVPRGEGMNGTSPPANGSDFAKVLMRDPYTPCVYLCDLSRQYQPSFPVCYTPGCALASVWDTLPQSSVADNCPEVAAQGSRDFSASSLMIPSGTHLLAYGHSYLNQIFRVLLAANGLSLVRVESPIAMRVSPEYVRKGDPEKAVLCAGDGEFAGPKCNGASNCGYQDFVRYHLSNGATLTGVFNNYDLQSRPTDDDAGTAGVVANLTRFIRAGAGENAPYTHAWVMEPHGFSFSNYQRLASLSQQDPSKHRFPPHWQESSYGCGWSDAFWAVWNNEMPGKAYHVFPWGTTTDIASVRPPPAHQTLVPPSSLEPRCRVCTCAYKRPSSLAASSPASPTPIVTRLTPRRPRRPSTSTRSSKSFRATPTPRTRGLRTGLRQSRQKSRRISPKPRRPSSFRTTACGTHGGTRTKSRGTCALRPRTRRGITSGLSHTWLWRRSRRC